jgi:type IV pilus biogenesis protein PilP
VVSTTTTTTAPLAPTVQPVMQEPVSVGMGNGFEKEVTPLLREISKKRSKLEIRKLDRELEKLDEDALKAQAERDKVASIPAGGAIPVPQPQNANQVQPSHSGNSGNSMNSSSDLRVLMTYGSDNDLYAKISMGNEGGYPVRRGDILPDGRTVASIHPNFIEVVGKGKKLQRVPVTGPMPVSSSGQATGPVPTTLPINPPNGNVIMLPPMVKQK